jgi:hypothetical protein
MKILRNDNSSGAYPPIQEGSFSECPEGCLIVPDDMDTTAFAESGGFVSITSENGIVTGMTEIAGAWDAWKAAHPSDPSTPAPTVEDRVQTLETTTTQLETAVNALVSGDTGASA